MMKKLIGVTVVVLIIFLLTGCGSNLFIQDVKADTEGVIKLGQEFITVDVVRWKIKDDRIKILTTDGKVYDVLYCDVAIVDKN